MKICMLGAGALGSAIGGTLAAAGSDIWLVDVYKPHVDAINAQRPCACVPATASA